MGVNYWSMNKTNGSDVKSFARSCGIPEILAAVLLERKIDTPEKVRSVLDDNDLMESPFCLKDMQKAVERITTAIENNERIVVYGDYDCDGVTATALLAGYLENVGADVTCCIPDRASEGYGLNMAAVDRMHSEGITLIITVDNGISAIEEVAYASSLGIDTVITDHHVPTNRIPDAVAVVDPHRQDCDCFKNYAGVGVAFKLVCALERDVTCLEMIENYGDLLCLGTLGDVVPLVGENRTIVRMGLRCLENSANVGITQLVSACGLEGRINSETVAFGLVPKINAAGRLRNAEEALLMLMTDDPGYALQLAQRLIDYNDERRKIEADIFFKAIEKIEADPSLLYQRVLIVRGENWNSGVIGIVASRFVEKFKKPCILLTEEDGQLRGSARSVEGFSIIEAIAHAGKWLNRYGGHDQAAGLQMNKECFNDFTEEIKAFTREKYPLMPLYRLNVSAEVSAGQLDCSQISWLDMLEPFGHHNERPLFVMRDLIIRSLMPTGRGNHIRLKFQSGDRTIYAIWFGMTEENFIFRIGDAVDIAAEISNDVYNGQQRVSVRIRDIHPSGFDQDDLFYGLQEYERFMREEYISSDSISEIFPEREDFVCIYKALRSEVPRRINPEKLGMMLRNRISYKRIRICVEALCELQLIRMVWEGQTRYIELIPASNKVELWDAPVMQRLKSLMPDQL